MLDAQRLIDAKHGDVVFFDQLPPEYRKVLLETSHCFSAEEVLRHLREDFPRVSPNQLAYGLKQLDDAIEKNVRRLVPIEFELHRRASKMAKTPRANRHRATLSLDASLYLSPYEGPRPHVLKAPDVNRNRAADPSHAETGEGP